MRIRNFVGWKVFALCCAMMLLACGCSKTEPTPETEAPTEVVTETYEVGPQAGADGPVGYLDCIRCQDGFLACGTGGRLDFIDIEGNVTPCDVSVDKTLRTIYCEGGYVAVCGDGGTLLESTDAGLTFHDIAPNTDENLTGVTLFQGKLYVSSEKGGIYVKDGANWERVQMETDHDLIGVVSTMYGLAAVSTETDVCISQDGEEWLYENFNEVYEGMYPVYVFNRLVPAGETFFVLGYGMDNPGMPLVMYTGQTDLMGDVWMQKYMQKLNGEYVTDDLDMPINDICFCADQIVGALNDGGVLALTTCVECNEFRTLEDAGDLWAVADQETCVLVCGEDFYFRVLDNKQVRQDKIKAEQAKNDMEWDFAILIDVREASELEENGYIPGSIHIPLAEVEERLPEVAPDPDQEIIFYCASGKRSQTATELAVEMGYTTVYNLGGLSDWPYEIVKD